MIASYAGPQERFVIFTVDAKNQVIMNSPPYSYRWDTGPVEPGVHTVRVQVLGEGDSVLVDQASAFIVVPGESTAAPTGLSDDL